VLGETRNELGGSEYYELFDYVGANVPHLDTEATRPLYQALQGAIAGGLAASCRGLYRGGLAVHLAMVAFAGGLGMHLDLSRVPTDGGVLRDDQVLFSESCGRFLVTVSPTDRQAFEGRFVGLPCACVGEVTAEPRLLVVGQAGETLLDESIQALKDSWHQG
jgi:phosphoribosylformylglycinamidine synthase